MSFKDYYNILGLESNKVTIDEIKVAYREQAKKYHPDMHIGDNISEEKFKDINEAYRVLSNEKARRKTQKSQTKKRKTKKNTNIKPKEEGKPKSARGRKKTPQEIREEMLKKLNESNLKNS